MTPKYDNDNELPAPFQAERFLSSILTAYILADHVKIAAVNAQEAKLRNVGSVITAQKI